MTIPELRQLAHSEGLEAAHFDEVVRDTAATVAEIVNNDGVEEQIRYLVSQLDAEQTERIIRAGGNG